MKKTAFSVAEAMVVLVLVSISLAAMAPMLSKKMVNTSQVDNSKWSYAANKDNITRPQGNVGVGVATNKNPQAKLHVSGGAFLAENNNKKVTIANGTNNAIVNYDGENVASYITINGDLYKRVGGDDVMQTVPSGMLAFFDGACPKGWTNMSTKGWGGRFLRVAGYDNTMSVNVPHGQWQNQAVGYHEHDMNIDIRSVNTYYGGGGGPYSPILSGDNQYYDWWSKSSRVVKVAGGGGAETRPNNIALNLCRKN